MNLTDKLITVLKRGTPVYGTIQKSFSKKDALEILEECLKLKITVFGGDVVEYKNNYFEHNYDNWSCERKKMSLMLIMLWEVLKELLNTF